MLIYQTSETFTWRAASAKAALTAPQSAYNIGAVPGPSITQALHVTSVQPGQQITLSLVDEQLAIDPSGSGTVNDFFNGKTTGLTGS
jgi:hypothetical protein